MGEVRVKSCHQARRCMILQFPKCGDNAPGASFDKCVDDIGDALFAHRADASVARRKRHESRVKVKIPDFAHLKETIV